MIVLLDLEWIENGWKRLTQLSALRVDDNWERLGSLDVIVNPGSAALQEQDHVALGGMEAELYQNGVTEEDCLLTFQEWLKPGDLIWVWAKSNKQLLEELWLRTFPGRCAPTSCSLAKTVRKKLDLKKDEKPSAYSMLERLGLRPPKPEHRASNDVEAMRMLFSRLGLGIEDMPAPSRKTTAPLSQRERNRRMVEKTEYNYIFLKGSGVFHCRACRAWMNARFEGEILGSVYYETAAKEHRPCKLCNPAPYSVTAPISDQELAEYEKSLTGELHPYQNEIIRAKMLTGACIDIKRGKIIGWCHNTMHRGAVNREILETHDCLGKKCRFLERNVQSPFWTALEIEKETKEKRKEKLRQEKLKRANELDELRELAESWQSYLKDMSSDMLIVRIAKEKPSVYKVYYVSDKPGPDWDQYDDFLDLLRFVHPRYWVRLQRIRDVDGHLVTRDEYTHRSRK